MIEIIHPGPLCTVQDNGRPGWAHLGVGSSGAADDTAHSLANRLVGNDPSAATLECTFGGLRIRFLHPALVALTGAPCAVSSIGGPPVAHHDPVAVPAGTELSLGLPTRGLRTYLAIRGGLDTEMVMGSRSTDLLSGLGHPPLVAGEILAIGADPGSARPTEIAAVRPHPDGPITLWPGPRVDWFTSRALADLTTTPYEVLPTSNRIGTRLSGVALERDAPRELPSEALVEGAVQVPNDGQPLIFLADHPVTGGYPVVAVVDPGDIGRVAQARPGDALRFRWH